MIEVLFILVIVTASSMVVVSGRAEIEFDPRRVQLGRETSKEVRRKRQVR